MIDHSDGLAQNCINSSANTLELTQSCTKPSISAQKKLFPTNDLHNSIAQS